MERGREHEPTSAGAAAVSRLGARRQAGAEGRSSRLLNLQRAAGNHAVQRLLAGDASLRSEVGERGHDGRPGPAVQRLTVNKFKKTAEVGDNDGFKKIVNEAVKNKTPGELNTVVKAISEAAGNESEDLGKLSAGLKFIRQAWEGKHGANTEKVTALITATRKADGAIRDAEKKRAAKQKEAASKAAREQEVKKDAALYWTRLQNPNLDHGLEVAWLVYNAGFEVAAPHRWFVSGWDQAHDGYGLSCEIVDKKAILPPNSPALVIHYHCNNDGTVRAQSVKPKLTETHAGGNIFASTGNKQFQFPPPPVTYTKDEIRQSDVPRQ